MDALWLFLAMLPPALRTGLWILLGAGLAAMLWYLQPTGKSRRIVPAAYFVLHAVFPYGYHWVKGAVADFAAAKEAWLAATCREIVNADASPTRQVNVEGFLITANYDRLINERFQRAAALEYRKDGYAVDTGKYREHPVRGAIPGPTFAAMAHALLTQQRFSFVEFEMLPSGWDNGYSNAGNLNTSGWSGKRYRRYYLAPGGDGNCVRESGETPEVSGGVFIGTVYERLALERRSSKPMCLALEIVDRPISKLRVSADEPAERMYWQAKIRGIPVPMWTVIRSDRIQVWNERDEIYRDFGFDYPNELAPRFQCHSSQRAAAIVGKVLAPDVSRAFYREKAWYAGSAVQAFYEPAKVELAKIRPEPVSAPSGDTCPSRRHNGDSRVVADQLEDFMTGRAATSIESKVGGGSEPASLFRLGQDAVITKLAWSGVARTDSAEQTFLLRIFEDSEGVPGKKVREFETAATVRSTGKWKSSDTRMFEARPKNLRLPAGDYWLSVLSAGTSQPTFFWAFEPTAERPQCGSGGIIGHYGHWTSDITPAPGVMLGLGGVVPVTKPPPPDHHNARGFSFRMEIAGR